MKKADSVLLVSVITLMAVLASCVPAEKHCAVDSDCAAAACCHASDAVNKAYKPDCQGQFCTLECKPDTLDCGQAKIACVSKQCTIVPIEE